MRRIHQERYEAWIFAHTPQEWAIGVEPTALKTPRKSHHQHYSAQREIAKHKHAANYEVQSREETFFLITLVSL